MKNSGCLKCFLEQPLTCRSHMENVGCTESVRAGWSVLMTFVFWSQLCRVNTPCTGMYMCRHYIRLSSENKMSYGAHQPQPLLLIVWDYYLFTWRLSDYDIGISVCGREREGHNSKLVSFGTLIMVWTSSFLVKVAILLIKTQTHGQNSHSQIILGSSTYRSFLLTMAGYQKKHIPKMSKLHHVVDIALIGECTCGIWMTADALCSQWIWVSSALSWMCVCVCV